MSNGFEVKRKEPRYRIEELSTNGWFLVEDYDNLTKEQTNQLYHELLRDGTSPKRLRITRIS